MQPQIRKPGHPGGILRRMYIEPLALTVTALASHLGVSRKQLSSLLNEKSGITPDMALRLSRAFGTTPDLWMNMQKTRDLWEASHSRPEWASVEPLPGMAKVQSDV